MVCLDSLGISYFFHLLLSSSFICFAIIYFEYELVFFFSLLFYLLLIIDLAGFFFSYDVKWIRFTTEKNVEKK
jgi:hypothetical protein